MTRTSYINMWVLRLFELSSNWTEHRALIFELNLICFERTAQIWIEVELNRKLFEANSNWTQHRTPTLWIELDLIWKYSTYLNSSWTDAKAIWIELELNRTPYANIWTEFDLIWEYSIYLNWSWTELNVVWQSFVPILSDLPPPSPPTAFHRFH